MATFHKFFYAMCHVFRKPTPRDPFGFLRSVPRVPKAHTERPLRIPSECATCPESLHRDTPSDSFGVCHVSREVKNFFPADLKKTNNTNELSKCILKTINIEIK